MESTQQQHEEELNHAMFEPSPRGNEVHTDAVQAATQHLSPDMSGPILVIDDEPYILRSLSYLLAREGYTVETASNGEEGLQRVRSLRPPLVFLDIMMPHMNGYEVCEQVKQDPALEGTYVIMLSAKGQQIDRERGLLGGADEYMTKPFSPREVAQRVRTILAERAAAAASAA